MKNRPYPYNDCLEPDNFKELLDMAAETYGEKTAFCYRKKGEDFSHSFIQLRDDVNALGTYFHSIGLKGVHIALLSENSYEWIITYLAAVVSGNVIVPLDKELDCDTLSALVKKADASVIIHSIMYKDEAQQCGVSSINMIDFSEYIEKGKRLIDEGDKSYISFTPGSKKMCSIVFTSGTTGEPKGVMLCQNGLIKDAISCKKNLLGTDYCMAILPFHHTFGFMSSAFMSILYGYTVYISSSIKRVMQDIKYFAPEHISVVPMMLKSIYNGIWNNIRENGKEKQVKRLIVFSNILMKFGIDIRRRLFKQIYESFGGRLKMIISGGALIDEKYIKGFRDIGIKITNGYGITECSPIVATMRDNHYSPASVGAVHPGIECRIKDGEIQIKGENVFLGYYKDEKATAEAFDGEWFKTGDLGYIDDDGLLYITGRKKNLIIISNGKNISPEELEAKISEFPDVKEVLVYGENDKIIAEIFTDNTSDNIENNIRKAVSELNDSLPLFKRISTVRFRETEFPKTSTKKIIRNERV